MAKYIKCSLIAAILCGSLIEVMCEFCHSNGHTCSYPDRCCGDECCVPTDYEHQYTQLRFNIWNMWYFWFAVLFTLMTCLGACGYWRKRRLFLSQDRYVQQGLEHQYRTNHLNLEQNRRPLLHQLVRLYPTRQGFRVQLTEEPVPVNRTAGEVVQGAFPSPPPYSEVISKPLEFSQGADKDSLPPYPGLPLDTDATRPTYAVTASSGECCHASAAVATIQMPGLPPYTAIPPEQLQPPPPLQTGTPLQRVDADSEVPQPTGSTAANNDKVTQPAESSANIGRQEGNNY